MSPAGKQLVVLAQGLIVAAIGEKYPLGFQKCLTKGAADGFLLKIDKTGQVGAKDGLVKPLLFQPNGTAGGVGDGGYRVKHPLVDFTRLRRLGQVVNQP